MDSNRILEIAQELGKSYRDRADVSIIKWQGEQGAALRELDLTPPDGWPGKNAEQRDTAKAKALGSDQVYLDASEQIRAATETLMRIDAKVQELEAERRALEWQVRIEQVEALRARPQGDHASQDGKLFDEQLQFHAEEQAWAETGHSLYAGNNGGAPSAPDDLPF